MWSGHAFADMLADGADRWALFESFVAEWHDPLSAADGLPEDDIVRAEQRLGLALPEALRTWYRLAGRRLDLGGYQDRLLPPGRLQIAHDVLVFYVESHRAVEWGVRASDLSRGDPPVVIADPEVLGRRVWLPEAGRLSDFALLSVLRETITFGRWMALAIAGERLIEETVLHDCWPLLFPPSHWPKYPTAFYAGTNAIALTCPGMVQIAARNEATLAELLSRTPPGVEWERERP